MTDAQVLTKIGTIIAGFRESRDGVNHCPTKRITFAYQTMDEIEELIKEQARQHRYALRPKRKVKTD